MLLYGITFALLPLYSSLYSFQPPCCSTARRHIEWKGCGVVHQAEREDATQPSQGVLVENPLTGYIHENNPEARNEETTVWQKREPQKKRQIG